MASRGGRVRFFFDADTASLMRGTRQVEAGLTSVEQAARRQVGALGSANASYQQAGAQLGITAGQARKLSEENQKLSKTHGEAEQSSRRLTTATTGLGASLARSAVFAGAAGAAYLGISQARSAVTATEGLAKSTQLLHQNLGLSVKSASELSALVSARGGSQQQLATSMKTFASQIEQGAKGSKSASEQFTKLGVSQKELAASLSAPDGAQVILGKVSDGLNKLGPGLDKTAITGKLFGRSFATLSPILGQGSKAMQDQMKTADKLGASFSDLGLKKMEELRKAQINLKLSTLGLQVSFTQAITPALMAASKQMSAFAQIMRSPNLTWGQKWKQITDVLLKDFSKVAPQLTQFATVWATAIASSFATNAPKIAAAFVKGFVAAPVWGQLIVGGWLLSKFGGVGAFSREGGRAGGSFGKAFALGMVTLGAAQLLQDKGFQNALRKVTNIATPGASFGSGVLGGLGNALKLGFVGLTAIAVAPTIPILAAWKLFGHQIGAVAKSIGNWMSQPLTDAWKFIGNTFTGGVNAAKGAFQNFGRAIRGVAGGIASAVSSMANAVKGALQWIVNAVSKVVSAFGALKNAIPNISLGNIPSPAGILGGILGIQRGGQIPGFAVGDIVPAMLEPGEFVLNKNAVAQIGPTVLAAVNKAIPRFAQGGPVAGQLAPIVVSGSGPLQNIAQGGVNQAEAAANAYIAKMGGGAGNVAAFKRAAERMAALHKPYLWGGGHGSFSKDGAWDCSGAWSELIHEAAPHLIKAPVTSGSFMGMFQPGKGPVTIYASPSHVFGSIGGTGYGTSASNPGGGFGRLPYNSRAGMAVRHVPVAKTPGAVGAIMGRAGQPAAPGFQKGGLVGASVFGGPGDPSTGTVGYRGDHLPGKMAYAELDMGLALGSLPYKQKLKITHGGKSVIAEKLDIGAGGGPVQGHHRAIDLWYQTAAKLGISGLGLVTISKNLGAIDVGAQKGGGKTGGAAAGDTGGTGNDIPAVTLRGTTAGGPDMSLADTLAALSAPAHAAVLATPSSTDDEHLATLEAAIPTASHALQAAQRVAKHAKGKRRHAAQQKLKAAKQKKLKAQHALATFEAGLFPAADGTGATPDDQTQAQLQAEQLAQLQVIADNLKILVQNTQNKYNVSQSNLMVLKQAIADVASGQLGGKIGLGFQSPSYAGGTARY